MYGGSIRLSGIAARRRLIGFLIQEITESGCIIYIGNRLLDFLPHAFEYALCTQRTFVGIRLVDQASDRANRPLDKLHNLSDGEFVRQADKHIAPVTATSGFDEAGLLQLTEYHLEKSLRDGLGLGDISNFCWALPLPFRQFKYRSQSIQRFLRNLHSTPMIATWQMKLEAILSKYLLIHAICNKLL